MPECVFAFVSEERSGIPGDIDKQEAPADFGIEVALIVGGRPAPTTLNRPDDLNAIGRIGHRHGCMPHT